MFFVLLCIVSRFDKVKHVVIFPSDLSVGVDTEELVGESVSLDVSHKDLTSHLVGFFLFWQILRCGSTSLCRKLILWFDLLWSCWGF